MGFQPETLEGLGNCNYKIYLDESGLLIGTETGLINWYFSFVLKNVGIPFLGRYSKKYAFALFHHSKIRTNTDESGSRLIETSGRKRNSSDMITHSHRFL